jgi:protein-S-isoprenylcysteine O-methyltransferase Ste14
MVTLVVNGISILLALIVVGIAIKKWNIIRDRRQILSVIQTALKERKALLSGILIAVFYLAVFMILGGKGGRIHVLFGRVIWNTTPGEVLTGLLLAMLVMISMALFVFGVRLMGAKQTGKKSGMGFFGSLLALLAAFCP